MNGSGRTVRALAAMSVVLAVLPIAVATVRGVRDGWLPVGDNAFFEVRARDVLTEHHPLVGTWTSASINIGEHVNNPGPLYFDLLALPTKLGGVAGLAVGVALVNALSVLGIAFVAWRRAGAVAATAAMAMASALEWTMGSELLYDPWQPHSLLLPFLLLLTLVWSVWQGGLWALPWAVATASLVVQTHFSYAILVALLGGAALTGLVVHGRRTRDRRRAVLVGAVSLAVALACWAQPLIDEVDGDGHGNLSTLLTTAGGGDDKMGPSFGTRLAGSVLALPPFWGRPSIAEGLTSAPPPELGVAAAAMAVLVAALVAVVVVGRRRRDGAVAAAGGLALVAVAGGLVTSTLIPVGIFGVAAHQFRWLWPIGVFVTFALLLGVARAAAGGTRGAKVPAAALATLVAVLAAAALPAYNPRTGPTYDADVIPSARRLLAQLDPLEGRGPVLLDVRNIRFAEPYNLAVMAELQRRDIEFRVDEEGMSHQLGRSRIADGTETGRILQRDRDDVLEPPPPGSTLVAKVEGLTAAERLERDRLRQEVARYITTVGLRLNAAGRDAWDVEDVRELGTRTGTLRTPEPFVRSDTMIEVVRRDLVDLDPAWRPRIERYVDLLERWHRHTVAIYFEPTP